MRPDLSSPAKRQAVFHREFREDLQYWVKTGRRTALRIVDLVEATLRDEPAVTFQGSWPPAATVAVVRGCGQAGTATVCAGWLLVETGDARTPAGV